MRLTARPSGPDLATGDTNGRLGAQSNERVKSVVRPGPTLMSIVRERL